VARPQRTIRPLLCPRQRDGEPQYVCGADTYRLRQQPEIKPECVTGCRLSRAQPSGKKVRNPLLGVVCLLTTGVLIRVRRRLGTACRLMFLYPWGVWEACTIIRLQPQYRAVPAPPPHLGWKNPTRAPPRTVMRTRKPAPCYPPALAHTPDQDVPADDGMVLTVRPFHLELGHPAQSYHCRPTENTLIQRPP